METAEVLASLHQQISAFLLYASVCLALIVFGVGALVTKALAARG